MPPVTSLRRRSLPKLVRDEQGQGMVEFALLLPVLLLVLVGIIEFGTIYSHVISMRQGVREAGRQGSVGQFGNSSCPVTVSPVQTAQQNTDDLICVVKDQAGATGIAVKVKFDTTYAAGQGLVVCAIYPLAQAALTGLIPLGNRAATTKSQFRLENIPVAPATGLVASEETAPPGQNWNFCT